MRLGLGIGIGMFRAVMSTVQPTLTLSISPTNPVSGQTVTITGIVGGFPAPTDFLAIGVTIDGAAATLSGTGLTRTFVATAGVASINAAVSNLFGMAVDAISAAIAPSSSLSIPISSGAWTAAEAAADADTRKSYVEISIAFQSEQIGVYRGSNSSGDLNSLGIATWDGTKYVWTSTGQNTRGAVVYHRVARILANGTREWITSDVKTFTASDVPDAVDFTYTPTASGVSTITFGSRNWQRRTGTGGEYGVNGGAWVPFTGFADLDIGGLSGSGDNVSIRLVNANVDATHPAGITTKNVASGVAPSIAASASFAGRVMTITAGTVTGTPTPTVTLDTLTLNGVDVKASATGTGPWSYTVPSSTADSIVVWRVKANNTAGDGYSGDTETVLADTSPGTITLSMASARIGQPITLSTTLDTSAYSFYVMFKDALDDDESATNVNGGWRLYSGQKAQTGLVLDELACGRTICVMAYHKDTGARLYSNTVGPIGYEVALSDNGTTIRQVADETALAALSLTGVTTLLLASGRTWLASALNSKVLGLDRSASPLSIRSSDPADPVRFVGSTGPVSIGGAAKNITIWRLYHDYRSLTQTAPQAFVCGDSTVDCGFYACNSIGLKMSDALLLGTDLTTAYDNYGAKAFDFGNATRPIAVGNLVKWCWNPYQFNADKGARIERNFVRGYWMDGARSGTSGASLAFDYTASGNRLNENIHELCIGYSEEAAVYTGNVNNNNPHPDALWQTFGGAHHNNEAIGNISVPGRYRGAIDHPTFTFETAEIHGILNNGYSYSPYYAGNLCIGIGATGMDAGSTGGDIIQINNASLSMNGQSGGMYISMGGSNTSGTIIASDNIVSGNLSAPTVLLDGAEPMIDSNNYASVSPTAGNVVRWGFGATGPMDAVEGLQSARPAAGVTAGPVTSDGYMRLTKSSRPGYPSTASVTAIAGGIRVNLTDGALNGGTVIRYLARGRPAGATYWLRPRRPFESTSASGFEIGGSSFPYGNTSHEFQIMVQTTLGYSQWSPIFTATPLVMSSATPPAVTFIGDATAPKSSGSTNSKTMDFWVGAGLADTTKDHVAMAFMDQTGGGIRGIGSPSFYWTTQALGNGTAIPVDIQGTSVAGTSRKLAVAGHGRPDTDARGIRIITSGSGSWSGYAGGAVFRIDGAYDPLSVVQAVSGGISAGIGTRTVNMNVPSGSKLLCYAIGKNGAVTWTGPTQISSETDTTDTVVTYAVATQDVSVGGPITVSCANCNGLVVVAVPAVVNVPKMLLLVSAGNSHMDGRTTASGDVFPSISRQFTDATPVTAGTITTISGAVLSNGDNATPSNGIGPMMQANVDLAATGEWAQILNVQVGEGASGFQDTRWDAVTAAGAGNNLSKLKDKVNAAYSAALAAGWTNIEVMFVWLNSKPDVDNGGSSGVGLSSAAYTTAENYVARAKAARQYLIDNCPCFANLTATSMNCAITLTQLTADTANYYPIVAAMNGLKFQDAGFGRADPIFTWGSSWDAGLPVTPFDGVHANRAGEITKGHLIADALIAARTNLDPWSDWKTLSFWSEIASLYHFRTGRFKDWKGSIDLTQEGSSPASLEKGSVIGGGLVWKKTSSSTSGRVFRRAAAWPTSYTIFARVSIASAANTGFFGNNTASPTTDRQAFHYSTTNGFTLINKGTAITRAYTMPTNTKVDVVLTYDSATQIAKFYANGTQVGADMTGVSTPATSGWFYLGANSGGSSPQQQLIGEMGFLGIVNRALTAGEVAEITAEV